MNTLYMMDLVRSIQETATWIEKVNQDFETNLYRTAALSPQQYFYEIPFDKKSLIINHVINMRNSLLNEANVQLSPVIDLMHYGRIMFFDADDTVVDGAPETCSQYYIDIGDAPPWDTWLALGSQLNELSSDISQKLKDNILVAWVPNSQYYYADLALQVACIDNFEWEDSFQINDNYADIQSLFTKPVTITQLNATINYEKRTELMQAFDIEMKKNIPLF